MRNGTACGVFGAVPDEAVAGYSYGIGRRGVFDGEKHGAYAVASIDGILGIGITSSIGGVSDVDGPVGVRQFGWADDSGVMKVVRGMYHDGVVEGVGTVAGVLCRKGIGGGRSG